MRVPRILKRPGSGNVSGALIFYLREDGIILPGVRNLYKYVHLYSGADPVFDKEDVFKLTISPEDNDSPERGKRSEKRSRYDYPITARESISISEYTCWKKTGITPRVVEQHISKLKADGILFRGGAEKWQLLGC